MNIIILWNYTLHRVYGHRMINTKKGNLCTELAYFKKKKDSD